MNFKITKKSIISASLILIGLLLAEVVLIRNLGHNLDLLDYIALTLMNVGAVIMLISSRMYSDLNRLGLPEDGTLRRNIVYNYNLNRLPEDASMYKYLSTYSKAQLLSVPQYRTYKIFSSVASILLFSGILLWYRHDSAGNYVVIAFLLTLIASNWLQVMKRKKVAENYIAGLK